MAVRGSTGHALRLVDEVPEEELSELSLAELFNKYVAGAPGVRYEIWFHDITPTALEVALPTTDAKLNYLSHTAKIAADLRYGIAGNGSSAGQAAGAPGPRDLCVHAQLMRRRREHFSQILNKFLDLHQILGGLE